MASYSFDQVEAFIAVVKHGSFSAAARALSKDRSTIHQLIGFLEIDWGVELFDRQGKLPKLKPEAQRLYQYANLLLEQRIEVQNIADNLSRAIEDELTISYDEVIPRSLLIDTEQQISLDFPSTCIHWLKQDKAQAIAAIKHGDVDISVQLVSNRNKPIEGLAGINVGRLLFSAYVGKHSHLPPLQPCPQAVMQTKPQLVLKSFIGAKMEQFAIVSPNYRVYSELELLVQRLSNTQNEWAVLPEHMARQYVKQGLIQPCQLEFANTPIAWSSVLLSAQQSKKGLVFQKAMQVLSQGLKQLPPQN